MQFLSEKLLPAQLQCQRRMIQKKMEIYERESKKRRKEKMVILKERTKGLKGNGGKRQYMREIKKGN